MNTVDVDPAALAAEAERAIAGAFEQPAAPAGGPQPGAESMPAPQSWRPLIEGLVPTVRLIVFAQWNIAPNLQEEFIASLSQSLDVLFPGGLEGKYAPFVRLLACSAGITFAAYAANGNTLPPLGLKKPDAKPEAAATAAA